MSAQNARARNGGLLGAVAALAITLVVAFEGYSPTTYLDPLGIPTICWGHAHSGAQWRARASRQECEALLAGDLAEANATVHRCITVPMLPHQEAALTSFAFNVGPGGKGVKDGICTLKSGAPSTLRVKANAGDWPGACAELSKWTKGRGITLPGLVKRRAAERAVCEGRTDDPNLPAGARGVARSDVPAVAALGDPAAAHRNRAMARRRYYVEGQLQVGAAGLPCRQGRERRGAFHNRAA